MDGGGREGGREGGIEGGREEESNFINYVLTCCHPAQS